MVLFSSKTEIFLINRHRNHVSYQGRRHEVFLGGRVHGQQNLPPSKFSFSSDFFENATFECVSRKKLLNYPNFWGDAPRRFLDWKDASPRSPPLSAPMSITFFRTRILGLSTVQPSRGKRSTEWGSTLGKLGVGSCHCAVCLSSERKSIPIRGRP